MLSHTKSLSEDVDQSRKEKNCGFEVKLSVRCPTSPSSPPPPNKDKVIRTGIGNWTEFPEIRNWKLD